MLRLSKDVNYYAAKMNESSVGVLKTLGPQHCAAVGEGQAQSAVLSDALDTLAALSLSLMSLKKQVSHYSGLPLHLPNNVALGCILRVDSVQATSKDGQQH